MKRFLALLLSITVSGTPVISSAASTAVPAAAGEKTAKEWAAQLGPKSLAAAISECIDSVKTTGRTTSVTLVNGMRVDTVKQADGKAKTINTFDSNGALVQAVDVASAANPERRPVASYVARDDGYQAMKKMAKDAFLTSARNKCHAMAVKRAAVLNGTSAPHTDSINVGCYGGTGSDDEGSGAESCSAGSGGSPGNAGGEGGGAGPDEEFYGDLAGELVIGDLSAAQEGFAANLTTAPLMKCAVVISQCRESCSSWGNWAIGACIVLGGAIGKWNGGAGVLAGITCTWDATAWMEGCKRECNTPTIQCSQ